MTPQASESAYHTSTFASSRLCSFSLLLSYSLPATLYVHFVYLGSWLMFHSTCLLTQPLGDLQIPEEEEER